MSDKRDDDVTADFDQTNGLADGLQGDSDGTLEGEHRSEAERVDDDGSGTGADPLNDPDNR